MAGEHGAGPEARPPPCRLPGPAVRVRVLGAEGFLRRPPEAHEEAVPQQLRLLLRCGRSQPWPGRGGAGGRADRPLPPSRAEFPFPTAAATAPPPRTKTRLVSEGRNVTFRCGQKILHKKGKVQ